VGSSEKPKFVHDKIIAGYKSIHSTGWDECKHRALDQ